MDQNLLQQASRPDRTRRSSFENQSYSGATGQNYQTKKFGTKSSPLAKTYAGNKSYQTQSYQGKSTDDLNSRYGDKTASAQGQTARTFDSRYEGQEARTSRFAGEDRAATDRRDFSSGEKSFATKKDRFTERAQENSVSGDSFIISDMPMSSSGNALSADKETGRLMIKPAQYNNETTPSTPLTKSLSVDDVSQLLNKGGR
jgi:hypothetical protein